LCPGLTWRQSEYEFVIVEQVTGHGIAVLAVRFCTCFRFEEPALRRLEIVVDVDNRRSQRVTGKLEAMREGTAHSLSFDKSLPLDYNPARLPIAPAAAAGDFFV